MIKLTLTGIEKLRRAVNILDGCNESFNQRFTQEQLLKLVEIHLAGDWLFTPDEWSEQQISEALAGIVPDWNHDETPRFDANRWTERLLSRMQAKLGTNFSD